MTVRHKAHIDTSKLHPTKSSNGFFLPQRAVTGVMLVLSESVLYVFALLNHTFGQINFSLHHDIPLRYANHIRRSFLVISIQPILFLHIWGEWRWKLCGSSHPFSFEFQPKLRMQNPEIMSPLSLILKNDLPYERGTRQLVEWFFLLCMCYGELCVGVLNINFLVTWKMYGHFNAAAG